MVGGKGEIRKGEGMRSLVVAIMTVGLLVMCVNHPTLIAVASVIVCFILTVMICL